MAVPFGRLITAMITPMMDDGNIDLEAAAVLAKALVASGTEAIVSTGSTGEAATLSDRERVQVWEAVKAAVGPDVPVIAGATDNNTHHSIEMTQEAQRVGLDGVLLTVPAYNKPTQAGLVAHFAAIADATRLPCVLYNVPSRTSLNMEAQTTITLSAVPNIIGIKEASADMQQMAVILDETPEDFAVWSGNDSDTLQLLRIGGYGVISVASHLVGKQIAAMIAAQLADDPEGAAAIDASIRPLVDVLFCESNPIPLKFALNEIGFQAGPPRLPLLPASARAQAAVREELPKHTIDIKAPARA